ncbi:MAG: response regulator [Cyanobacteria bacterium P01_F01_bin.33]
MVSTSVMEKPTGMATSKPGSPARALQEMAVREVTGKLVIRDPADSGVVWGIYVGKGKVHYASSLVGQQERIAYLLQRTNPDLEIAPWENATSDYNYLCKYWQSGRLSFQQVRQLLFTTTLEALIHVLAIPEAELQVDRRVGLDPILISVPFLDTARSASGRIREWNELRSQACLPFQRPYLQDSNRLQSVLAEASSNPRLVGMWGYVLSQNYCLYDIGRHLKIDVRQVANVVRLLARENIIGINSFRATVKGGRQPLVACIDDSQAVQRTVKLTLEAAGYRVLGLTEPARALTTLARQQPDLVLMDITMPEVDGYELCRMLRQSDALGDIPIVMLTGRDGLFDRLRARVVGATDYMTKPFNAEQLLSAIAQLTSLAVETD